MGAKAALALVGCVLLLTAVYTYGYYRWDVATRDLHRRLDTARAPVQDYFRAVLKDRQAVVTAVSLEQAGQLRYW